MTDKMREAFEKWYLMQPIAHKSHIVRISNGHYFGAHTETAWRAWQAAQSVPVVGEPVGWVSTIECIGPEYKKKLFGRLPIQSLQAGYYSHTALYEQPTHSITAAELATLREKAARIEQVEKERDEANARLHDVSVACATAEQERDELRKALLALKEDCQTSNDCQYGTLSTSHVARIVDAAIAQGKGE